MSWAFCITDKLMLSFPKGIQKEEIPSLGRGKGFYAKLRNNLFLILSDVEAGVFLVVPSSSEG